MSKMSAIQMELSEQASDLGFASIEEAEANGYIVDYNGETWVLKPDVNKAQDQAHEAWLEERAGVLADLRVLRDDIWEENHDDDMRDALTRTIEFVEGCHD